MSGGTVRNRNVYISGWSWMNYSYYMAGLICLIKFWGSIYIKINTNKSYFKIQGVWIKYPWFRDIDTVKKKSKKHAKNQNKINALPQVLFQCVPHIDYWVVVFFSLPVCMEIFWISNSAIGLIIFVRYMKWCLIRKKLPARENHVTFRCEISYPPS